MFADFDPYIVMHLAALIAVVALALRDQLKLRSVLLVSIALTAVYNYALLREPSWKDLFWNAVTFTMNLVVLIQIILDRTHIGLSQEEDELFSAFQMLTPGEFRAIVKLATWRTAEADVIITQEGVVPDHLYYILRGGVLVSKGGRDIKIGARTFIGEVAFLHRRPASATVQLEPGTRYLEWPVRKLDGRIDGKQALKHAVLRLISFDMATKVARA
jgi:hypothetical protein